MTTTTSGTETHGHATPLDLFSGHTTIRQLGDANEPGKSTHVLLDGRKGDTERGDESPKTDLSITVLFVGFDNQTLCPLGSGPSGNDLADFGKFFTGSVITKSNEDWTLLEIHKTRQRQVRHSMVHSQTECLSH